MKNPVGGLDDFEGRTGVLHGLCKGFLAIDVAPGLDRLDGVKRVLEIRRGDDHGVGLGLFVKFLVVPVSGDVLVEMLGEIGLGLVPADAPKVRDSHEFAVEFSHEALHRREQRAVEPIRKSDDADANFLVCPEVPALGAGGLE